MDSATLNISLVTNKEDQAAALQDKLLTSFLHHSLLRSGDESARVSCAKLLAEISKVHFYKEEPRQEVELLSVCFEAAADPSAVVDVDKLKSAYEGLSKNSRLAKGMELFPVCAWLSSQVIRYVTAVESHGAHLKMLESLPEASPIRATSSTTEVSAAVKEWTEFVKAFTTLTSTASPRFLGLHKGKIDSHLGNIRENHRALCEWSCTNVWRNANQGLQNIAGDDAEPHQRWSCCKTDIASLTSSLSECMLKEDEYLYNALTNNLAKALDHFEKADRALCDFKDPAIGKLAVNEKLASVVDTIQGLVKKLDTSIATKKALRVVTEESAPAPSHAEQAEAPADKGEDVAPSHAEQGKGEEHAEQAEAPDDKGEDVAPPHAEQGKGEDATLGKSEDAKEAEAAAVRST